jgi:hypothetical protein
VRIIVSSMLPHLCQRSVPALAAGKLKLGHPCRFAHDRTCRKVGAAHQDNALPGLLLAFTGRVIRFPHVSPLVVILSILKLFAECRDRGVPSPPPRP